MYLINIFTLILISLLSSISCSIRHILTKRNSDAIEIPRKLHSTLYACGNLTSSCSIIRQFSIVDNSTFNCKEEYIHISFELNTKEKTITYGYLQEKSHIISGNQHYSKACKLIRK